MHLFTGIQHINYFLLHILIELIIQSIQLHSFLKNFTELLSDGRKRVCNNGKAPLIPVNIFVGNLSRLISIIDIQLLLFFIITGIRLFILRLKRLLSKNLNYRRTGMDICQFLLLFKGIPQHFQSPLHKSLIQIVGFIILMVIFILFIYRRSISIPLAVSSVKKRRYRVSGNGRL